jgi:inosine-uridine nucleoside N-ribohydrolase
MVGLDVTHRVVTPLHLFQRIADHHRHRATDTLHHAVAFYATFYSARHPHIAPTPSCFAHDVLAFIYLVEPELFKTVAGEVRVVTEGPDHGQTRFQPSPLAAQPPKPPKFQMTSISHEPHEPNQTHEPIGCQVCMEVDASASLALLEATLMGDWLSYSSKE